MENTVPCKRCTKEFVYVPGPSGNARQFCNECRVIVDLQELDRFKEEMIIEKNKYLVGAPGRKDAYDPSDILLNGNIPSLNSDIEKFICAVEFGKFIRKNGFANHMENVNKLFDVLGSTHRLICVREWSLERMEYYARHPLNKNRVEQIMKGTENELGDVSTPSEK